MPRKRKQSSSNDTPSAKRSRPQPASDDEVPSTSNVAPPQPPIDPIFGQKHAFPGLDDLTDEGALPYGPPGDGLEYLRMPFALHWHRSEARNLPSVFVAQGISVTNDGTSSNVRHHLNTEDKKSSAESQHRGIYSNGVYIALPPGEVEPKSADVDREAQNEEGEEQPDPQEMYYNLLRHRFQLLRSTLKCTPPASAIASLDDDHPISFPEHSLKAMLEWRRLLQSVEPQMVQLACMDTESVLRLIPIVTRSISAAAKSGEIARVKRLGAWAWGLLGRCRDVGQMSSEEVAEIRELGKRAVKILIKIRSPEIHKALEEVAGHDEETVDDSEFEDEGQQAKTTKGPVPSSEEVIGDISAQGPAENGIETETAPEIDDLEIAKARLRKRLGLDVALTNSPHLENGDIQEDVEGSKEKEAHELDLETRAMLDMIITVVGEFYGQRDLLEFRDIWEEDDQDHE